ncbi:MAG: CHC2 zinc finger domain-containing protein [Methylobacter sp.]|nr:CHC2 zinc finger domain-containing protein [Methylobacter sp.]
MLTKIDNFLNRLENVKQAGTGKWLSCCPAHDDRSPSLAVKLVDDDKISIHCFAGCAVADIIAAVNLTLADLMPDKPQGYDRQKIKAPKFSKYELFDLIAFESLILAAAVRMLLSGNSLDPDDLTRINQAEALIEEIPKECRA